MREFDVVVMGAGVAGEVAAGRLGQNGLSVAVVEDRLVGGECSYYACMPSKALLRPVELQREVERVAGLSIGPIDVPAVLARRDEVISNLDDSGQLPWLEEHGVTLVRGRGRLDGERRVVVDGGAGDGEELVARKAVVVATGSGALIPDIDGLARCAPVDEHRSDDREGGAGTARDPRRRRRRGRDGAGVVGLRVEGDARPSRRPADRARGAVRRRPGARGARGRWRRRPAPAAGGARDPSRRGGDRARRRHDVRGGRGAGGVRPPPRNLGHRPRDDRDRARRPARRRRRSSCSRPRLALRDRRRQRPRAAHAHGQVPGPAGRRHDPRPHGRAPLGRGASRPASSSPIPRSGPSASRSREPRRRASTSATSMSRRAATPAARSSATGRPAPRGSSSTRSGG